MGVLPRRAAVTAAVLLASIVVAAAAMRAVSANADMAAALSTAGAVAFAVFAVAAAWSLASRLQRGEPLQVQVAAIGAGMAALVAGDFVYWAHESLLRVEPYPSSADLLYIASFPLLGGGLLLALRAFTRGQRQTVPLAVSAAVSLAGTVAVWLTVLGPLMGDTEASVLEKALGAFYPLGDLWLLLFPALALALALVRFAGGRLATPWAIVSFGALAMAATDTAYTWLDYAGTYVSGSLVDVGWWVAYAAIGLGLVTLAEVQGVRGGRSRER